MTAYIYIDCNGVEVPTEVDPAEVPQGYDDATIAQKATETIPGMGRPTGYARAASYLIDVPAFARQAVVSDAHIQSNMCGGRYADAVWTRARDWRSSVRPGAQAARSALARS